MRQGRKRGARSAELANAKGRRSQSDRPGTRRREPISGEFLVEGWRREIDELLASAGAQGLTVDSQAPARLLSFCLQVNADARITGLVSKADLPLLVRKHVAASLGVLLVEEPSPRKRWIDVGSGGGFPGMVVKICRPDARIVLLDSSLKKTEFLSRAGKTLSLDGMEVVRGRVEKTPAGSPGFDVILMRAVASLSESLRLLNGIAILGTKLLTYKGLAWDKELKEANEAMGVLGWQFEGIHPVPWAPSRILKLVRTAVEQS